MNKMGLLRSFAKAFFGTIFTISLMSLLIVQNLLYLTTYDNMKNLFTQVAYNIFPQEIKNINLSKNQIEQIKSILSLYCQGKEYIDLSNLLSQLNIKIEGMPANLVIKCSQLDKIIPSDAESINATSMLSNVLFDSIYYKSYDCNFVECIMKAKAPTDYLILISSSFNSFLSELLIYLGIGTFISLFLFIFLETTWIKRINNIGWSLFWIGITPIIFIPMKSFVLSSLNIPPEIQDVMKNFVDPMINSVFNSFYIILILGISLIVVGYSLRFVYRKKSKR
jgi:hypothetical protein